MHYQILKVLVMYYINAMPVFLLSHFFLSEKGSALFLTFASSATSTQPIIVLFFMILMYSQFLILLWVLAPYASS